MSIFSAIEDCFSDDNTACMLFSCIILQSAVKGTFIAHNSPV